ncbi:MAG TPA: hypothetical protein VGQ84_05270 [Gaiellaceae bacterium]|jgi:hypothetical protein|nr:hypothetical protein [Gaiellaceae bacterium]
MNGLRPGLWRWTARHPEWEADAEPESPADWPPDVGCVAYAADHVLVLIDPLVLDGWDELDPLADRHARVAVLQTLRWHGRSVREAVARYDASTEPPAGVEPVEIANADETMFWLAAPRALVPGDRLIGDGAGGVRPCPDSWLGYIRRQGGEIDGLALREALRPLLDLPIELLLVSHGEPILSDGREALERALEV